MEWLFEDEDELIDAIDEALGVEVEGEQWAERVAALTPDTPITERLALYKELRDKKAIPPAASFFLIGWAIDTIAGEKSQELFKTQYEARFEEMEAKYHIDPDALLEEDDIEVPEEYEALCSEFGKAALAITIATFDEYGEHEMGALMKNDPEEYSRQYIEGGEYLLSSVVDFEDYDEDEEEEE